MKFSRRDTGFDQHLRDVIAGRSRDPELLAQLRDACRDQRIQGQFTHGSPDLYDEIFRWRGATGFGRTRGSLEYHQFQRAGRLDYVDDLRKTALYEIVARGFDLVAVSGNEFVLLLPHRHRPNLARISVTAETVKTLVEDVIGEHLQFVRVECRVRPAFSW